MNIQAVIVCYVGFTQIEVELVLLNAALNLPVHIDYFHLISGHDYTCRNKEDFDEFFEKCLEGCSFMHFGSD